MKLDAALPPIQLKDVPAIAEAAQEIGFDALWTQETQHDPFLPLAVAASVALAMSVEVASRSLQEQLRTTTQALIGSASLSISAGQVGVPEEALDLVAQVPGVLGASPLIRRSFRVASGPGRTRS